MFIRLKYAGFTNISVAEDIRRAVVDALDSDSKVVYVLVNYSALFPAQSAIKALYEERKQ